jgi:F-type H+-transporting ATPase subunit b
MNVLGIASTIIRPMSECGADEEGCTTLKPILPETAEIIYGGLASLIIFGALYKFAWPQIKKAMAARTERIQSELDAAAQARREATDEADSIRAAVGDIDGERARLLSEADEQAETVLADGRARLQQELAEIEAKAMADIEVSKNRVGDELRAEISRLSSAAVDHVVSGSLDAATHQELIESFIRNVGASK